MTMKSFALYILSAVSFFALASCDDDLKKMENTVSSNFNLLWKEVDEKYCFFEYKKDSIKDWNAVYEEYYPKAMACTSEEELFYVCSDMLNELKDGHVNLFADFDYSSFDIYKGNPHGYSSDLFENSNKYMENSRSTSGLVYNLLDSGNVGYVRYRSFSNEFGDSSLDIVLNYFQNTKGMIIDVRGNGGGYVRLVELLVSRFITEKTLVSYKQKKTGKGHNDFSKPEAVFFKPSENVRYSGLVAVLTDRGCYSATNDFVLSMKGLPNVLIIGDQTGGGAGLPYSSELPCGWTFRMSACPMYDRNMNITEFGIQPDVKVTFDRELAFREGRDNVIETAIELIKNN